MKLSAFAYLRRKLAFRRKRTTKSSVNGRHRSKQKRKRKKDFSLNNKSSRDKDRLNLRIVRRSMILSSKGKRPSFKSKRRSDLSKSASQHSCRSWRNNESRNRSLKKRDWKRKG